MNMVKYFSVDWLAQSQHNTARTDDHIPCMVQPLPPNFGKSYPQPKPKASTPVEHTEQQDPSLCSPLHPTICASPSKYSKLQTFNHQLSLDAQSSVCNQLLLFQFQKVVDIPPGMRARRPPLSVSLWTREARWRKTDHSAVCAPSSPPSRSANWKKSSTSTNTWTLERE